jgi:hypothetical protein
MGSSFKTLSFLQSYSTLGPWVRHCAEGPSNRTTGLLGSQEEMRRGPTSRRERGVEWAISERRGGKFALDRVGEQARRRGVYPEIEPGLDQLDLADADVVGSVA